MCDKCSKKTWVHAKQDKIKNGHKYVTYLEEYSSNQDSGSYLIDRIFELEDEYHEIWYDAEELRDNDEYFDEIIEYEQRYNKNGNLKRGKSYHPLDPNGFHYERIFPKPCYGFTRSEEGKHHYIFEYADSFYYDDEDYSDDEDGKEEKNKRKPIPKSVQREVWQRDEGKCVECGSKEKLEYDHIIPVSKNGSNTVRNVQLLCEHCNRSKSNKIG